MSLLAIASNYAVKLGLPMLQHARKPRFDRALLQDVANHYEAMPVVCEDIDAPATMRAYFALQSEILAQYSALIAAGFVVRFVDHQPYDDAFTMLSDIERGHLAVNASTGEPNAIMLSVNPMFRAIHDVFGHGLTGSDFSATGEDIAYHAHAQMFSAIALPALALETRGQNAWLNFGPYAQDTRPFPVQKLGTLPATLCKFTY